MFGERMRSARHHNVRPWCPRSGTTPRRLHSSKWSGCGRRCGRSPARWTMSPNPATISNTVAALTRYSSCAATTGRFALSRTCAVTGATRCAPARGRTWVNCAAVTTAGRGICAGVLKRVPNRKGFGTLQMSEFPLFAVRVDVWESLVFVNLDVNAAPLSRLSGGGAARHRLARSRRLPLLRRP